MQKKLIALAIAGFAAAPAFAQVTIYGVADAYVAAVDRDLAVGEAKNTVVDSGLLSGSRLGFKGEEDLGNGLKAVFALEYALSIDQNEGVGTTALKSRQQWVGLSSASLGRLSLGRQYAPGYFSPGNNDGFASALIAPQSALSAGAGMTITPNSAARINNSINWVSPAFGPVKLNAIYGAGETAKTPTNNGNAGDFLGLGATATFGPVVVDAAYHNLDKSGATTDLQQDEFFIGAAYDLGVVKLGASFQNREDESQVIAGSSLEQDLWTVSAIVPVGVGNIHVGYGVLEEDNTANAKAKVFSVAYTHALSKRTTAYAGYMKADADALPTGLGALGAVGGSLVANGTNTALAAGVRHTF